MSAIIGKRKIMGSASKTLFLVQTGQKELDLPLLFLLLQSINNKVFNHNIDLKK